MNAEEMPVDPVDEIAAWWAAKVRGGSLTDRERTELNAWLRAAPAHGDALQEYCELTAVLDVHLQRASAPKPRLAWWPTLTVASAALVAAAVVLGIFMTRPQHVTTDTGVRRTVALADGSRVELNARSEMIARITRHAREVRLLRGEGMFSVVKDANRPFVVVTSQGEIRVTGTVFDVRAMSRGGVAVTVLEGTVLVRQAGVRSPGTTLEHGNQAVLRPEGSIAVKPIGAAAAEAETAWRRGEVVFVDSALSEAMERFAPYDSRRIEVSPAVADLRVGGRFRLDDVVGAYAAIARILPVRVVTENDVVRLEPRPE